MANCKFCGKPVRTAPVYHKKCVTERMDKLTDEVCKTVCRYRPQFKDEDELIEQHCLYCPLVEILEQVT